MHAFKLANIIVDWNVNKQYSIGRLQGKLGHQGNCQDFVDCVLNGLGVTPSFTGALGTFLNEMRISGTSSMEFRPDQNFIEKFGLTKNSMVFASHAELDEFVASLQSKDSTFFLEHAKETELLKSFDRAFWCRHFYNTKDEMFKPKASDDVPDQICCPFGNPTITGSISL